MTKTKIHDITSFDPNNPSLVRNSHNQRRGVRLTPRFYKLLGVAALGTVLAISANHSSDDKEPQVQQGYITIENGDNGTTIGRELGDGSEHIKKIAREVQSQADENGYLQPGQVVHVNLENVDHPDLLMQDYDPSTEQNR